MKAKLKPKSCYMAGLSIQPMARNAVGVETSFKEIEERFIELALNEFHIDPTRIVIEEKDNKRLVYFYHSRVAKQLEEIRSRQDKLFKVPNELSRSYVAGLFDAMGRVSNDGLFIKGIRPIDEVMLANLGVHTRNGRVMNISTMIALIKGFSLLLKQHTVMR